MEPGTIQTLKWLPVGEPIPEGWKLANDMRGTNHGNYSVLIVQIETEKADKCES